MYFQNIFSENLNQRKLRKLKFSERSTSGEIRFKFSERFRFANFQIFERRKISL